MRPDGNQSPLVPDADALGHALANAQAAEPAAAAAAQDAAAAHAHAAANHQAANAALARAGRGAASIIELNGIAFVVPTFVEPRCALIGSPFGT